MMYTAATDATDTANGSCGSDRLQCYCSRASTVLA
jgi:hypothetical protein